MDYQPRIGARVRTSPRNWCGQFQKVRYGTVVGYGEMEGFIIVEYEDRLILGNHYRDLTLELLGTVIGLKNDKN